MAIAPSTASSFLSVRLVESATKGLVNTCQILEVDQDVITRNYSEANTTLIVCVFEFLLGSFYAWCSA